MKLLYFSPLLSTCGGQERTLLDKANYLVGQGHDVLFVTYEHEGRIAYPMDPLIKHVDLKCHVFRLYKDAVYLRFWRFLKLKFTFRKQMSDVISFFHPDVIDIAIPNTENFLCDVMAVAKNVPIVIESHLAMGYQVIKRGKTETWLYKFFNPQRAVCHADLFVSLTEGDAACWRQIGVKHLKIIPNPVTFYPDFLQNVKKKEGRIICVGRLTPQKRFDRLIDAFSLIAVRYPDWHITIFGEGEDKEKLQKQIAVRNLDNRIFLNPPTKDIYSHYMSSQFMVLSSDFEGFGLVIVEAMACGIPVVTTDCPFGPSEIIEDGKSGLLAKMDVKDLADKMEWMMTHDEERRLMGINAHQAAARFRKETIMPQWEEAYLSVIKS
jgi:glycosyltransferase involved in cell wall biosynthesis